MNAYFLSFTSSNNSVSRKDILDFLDTKNEVLNWFAVTPASIIIISEFNQNYLSKILINKFGNDITFLIAKIDSSTVDGYVGKNVWDFINHPKSSGRWK